MDKKELLDRTRQFAIRVFKLVEKFPKSEASKVIGYQLLKSSSSIAANYRAANKAVKSEREIDFLIRESDEFIAIFTASLKTLTKSKS